jgi:prolyl-tRNA editing enzyme YbaK/EbsC (Cys-tRNA(Pro) deacylase)
VIPQAPAYTSVAESVSLGVSSNEVVKSILVLAATGPAVMVIPRSRRLDLWLVRGAVEDRHARLATEAELERDHPEIDLGAVPPLGSLLGARTFVDREVFGWNTVAFATGIRSGSLKVRVLDLFSAEPIEVVTLTEAPLRDLVPPWEWAEQYIG